MLSLNSNDTQTNMQAFNDSWKIVVAIIVYAITSTGLAGASLIKDLFGSKQENLEQIENNSEPDACVSKNNNMLII
jgi:hypothetical protein